MGRRARHGGRHAIQYPARTARRKWIEKRVCIGHNNGDGGEGMSPKVKLSVYAVLVILAAWFAWGFHSDYTAVTRAAAEADTNAPVAAQPAGTNNPGATNAAAIAPPLETNAATNLPPQESNTVAPAETNLPPARTNASVSAPVQKAAPATTEAARRGAMIRYLAAFIGAVIGLGLLIARDITHYFGSQAVDYLFSDIGDAPHDPEYERAEAEWANGKFLDAIQIMRDFLKKNPRQLHVALRIAEIYEKDLGNHLAAALEYEEVLKSKLPDERWGWAAIHLCNLHYRLNQPDKAQALLQRIADEYPRTGAGRKARVRLGMAELQEEAAETKTEAAVESEPGEESPIVIIEAPTAAELSAKPPPEEPPPEPPKSNLPPGFRPKK
jgi:TolA-binding protein